MYKLRVSYEQVDDFIRILDENYTDIDVREAVFKESESSKIKQLILNSEVYYAFENYILRLNNAYYDKYKNDTKKSINELYRKKLLCDKIKTCLHHT